MLKVPDIKLPDTSISSNRSKDISFFGEVDIVNFLIMSDQLSENSGFLDVPDSTGSIDRTSADEVVELWIPVKRCQGSWKIIILS